MTTNFKCIVFLGMRIFGVTYLEKLELICVAEDKKYREIVLCALEKAFRLRAIHMSKYNKD